MTPRVGIVILNWNGGAHTIACVSSARAQSYANRFIVVVDNGSAPNERHSLEAHFGGCADVELCWLDENRGYAAGNNFGMRHSLLRGAELLVIATQDTLLASDAVERLVTTALSVADAGIVGPRILDATSGQELSVGERVSVPLLCVPRTLLRYRALQPPWREVSGVWGCALLMRPACFETTGGFDESLFAYYEEIDLCLRSRAAGFRIVCVPDAIVRHHGMRGFLSGLTVLSAQLKVRNLIRLMRRHARAWHWPVLIPTFAGLMVCSSIGYLLRGRPDIVAAMGRGLIAGWRNQSGPARNALSVS